MNKEDFYKYLKGDIEYDETSLIKLKQIANKYPYLQTAKLLYLKNLKDIDENIFIAKFIIAGAGFQTPMK